MLQINHPIIMYPIESEIVLVETSDRSLSFVGGGVLVQLECHPMFIRHLTEHTHGVCWEDKKGDFWLYVRDFSSLESLLRPQGLTGSMSLSVKAGQTPLLTWKSSLCAAKLELFAEDVIRPAPLPARAFPGELTAWHYRDFGTQLKMGDETLLEIPYGTEISKITPAPATLNRRPLKDGATVANAIVAQLWSIGTQSLAYHFFQSGLDRPCGHLWVTDHRCPECGDEWFELWDRLHGAKIPADLVKGLGVEISADTSYQCPKPIESPGKCPACKAY